MISKTTDMQSKILAIMAILTAPGFWLTFNNEKGGKEVIASNIDVKVCGCQIRKGGGK